MNDIYRFPDEDSPGEVTATFDRRDFIRGGLAGAASISFAALASRAGAFELPYTPDYGPLAPVADDATGLPLIALPAGFRYRTYGWTGQPMADRQPTPRLHDGMAVIAATGHHIVLVRNHEQDTYPATPGSPLTDPIRVEGRAKFDPNYGAGSTSNLIFNSVTGQWLTAWSSLSGTVRNCAGGRTPWGTWLTAEETENVSPAGVRHGWVFEVPAFGKPTGQPLRALGRAEWEASATDPATGYVYETEDATPGGFYQFVPNRYGQLALGGKLYALKVKGQDDFNFSGLGGVWVDHEPGTTWDVEWVEVTDPEANNGRIYDSAPTRACFARPEGAWYDSGKIYFNCTSGGALGQGSRTSSGRGQVFVFDPRRQTVEILFNSTGIGSGSTECNSPDNLAVSPRGGIVLCEDGSASVSQKVRGLTPEGGTFLFADNRVNLTAQDIKAADRALRARGGIIKRIAPADYTGSEWAGACFFEKWMFVNIQTPGITFAITGPWDNGAL